MKPLTPENEQPREDRRLYVPEAGSWQAHVKRGWDKQYCYYKTPGQDYLHLILSGEIFLQCGDEAVCLNCAIRRGLVTGDRLYWQHAPKGGSAPPP